ncbi:MAG TPA: hypothetical protein VLS25_05660 [Dehalococcoidia bacterium]|nr:hypothetical protein [Dehalococcoidia bacterium]
MTRPAFLVFVSVRFLAAAAALLALTLTLISCNDAQEEIAPSSQTPLATSSSAPSASAAPNMAPTPVPLPTGWQRYVDPVVDLSLAYPSDLAFKDLTASSAPDGMNQRVFEFQSAYDPARGIAISVSANPKGMTIKEWAIQFGACVPDTVSETAISGDQAITCTSDALIPGPAAVIAHGDLVYFISTTKVENAEFRQFLSLIQT